MGPNRLAMLSAVFAAALVAGVPSILRAADKPEPTLSSLHLDCSDFTHNSDGTWSPVRAISFNGIIMSPDVSYGNGTVIDGIKIVELLEHECVTG
jgi:hypothetical protein